MKNKSFLIGSYWLALVILPAFLSFFADSLFASLLRFYVLFIAPVVFFIFPYAKIKDRIKNKNIFIFWSLIFPYIIIYAFLAILFISSLRNIENINLSI